jgi:hypothetical protein
MKPTIPKAVLVELDIVNTEALFPYYIPKSRYNEVIEARKKRSWLYRMFHPEMYCLWKSPHNRLK